MELQVIDSIQAVSRQSWNDLVSAAGETVFHSYEWLRAHEAGNPVEARHVLLYDGSQLIAACPMYVETRDEQLDRYGEVPPTLIAHSFRAWYTTIITRRADGVAETVVLDTVEQIADEENVDVFGFAAIPESETRLRERLAGANYSVIQHNCSMVLDVPESMEAYMYSLEGSHRRDFRRRIRRDREAGVTAEFVDTIPFEQFRSLCHQVLKRHDEPTRRYSSEYLRAIRTHLEPYVRYGVVRAPNGEPMSAFLALETDERIYAWIAGIDYDYMDDHEPSLFGYYSLVEYAIEEDIPEVDVGRGLVQFKRKFGYRPRRTYLALKSPTVDLELDQRFPDAEVYGDETIRSCC